jgi:hypothetical protein
MERVLMLDLENDKWRVIAERLAVEMNPEKLTALVDELCMAMDREEQVVPNNSFQTPNVIPERLLYSGRGMRTFFRE